MPERMWPRAEANRITKILDVSLPPAQRYPVKIEKVALELSPEFNPDPITLVQGASLKNFEGALIPKPDAHEWGILYNTNIIHPGRIRFTTRT